MLTSYLALGVALYVLPGRQASGPLAVLGLVIAVAVVGVPLRPLLAGLAVVSGSIGLLMLGVLSQAIILDVAIAAAPHVAIGSGLEVLLVSWAAASVAAAVNWLFDAGNEEVFLDQLLGRAVRVAHRQRRAADGSSDGQRLLVIQFDGVGENLLRQAIMAGDVPTLSQWLRSTHTLRGWHTGLPATTPAAQAVLLHGDVTEVPSFRWYEKDSKRLMVANHPADAAEIERRISDGRGLLADGGVSVSNLFSGDATVRLLTMSDARLPSRQTRGLASFATTGGGLVRSLVVSGGQVITELYQGRRQRRRHVRPRVPRGAVFAVQRAVTSALLRDLTVAIVAEQIARGAPAIFVGFLDFDEVAHHAGPNRPESMHMLDGLDRLVRFFADIIRETGQDYDIAIVSDHGQAQGATFAQMCGRTLSEVVHALSADTAAAPGTNRAPAAGGDSAPAESWESVNLLLNGLSRSEGAFARAVTRAHAHFTESADADVIPGRSGPRDPAVAGAGESDLIVAVAGSLAHIYLSDLPGRLTRGDVDRRHPHLIAGLARHRHIGLVMVRSPDGVPVALGAHGWRTLTRAGCVGGEGTDPVAVFGPHAGADLWALDRRRHVGDVVVLGGFDPSTGEVAAFEDLVGSHGGLGGGQTDALLLHPRTWSVLSGQQMCGLDVHALLRSRLWPPERPDSV